MIEIHVWLLRLDKRVFPFSIPHIVQFSFLLPFPIILLSIEKKNIKGGDNLDPLLKKKNMGESVWKKKKVKQRVMDLHQLEKQSLEYLQGFLPILSSISTNILFLYLCDQLVSPLHLKERKKESKFKFSMVITSSNIIKYR